MVGYEVDYANSPDYGRLYPAPAPEVRAGLIAEFERAKAAELQRMEAFMRQQAIADTPQRQAVAWAYPRRDHPQRDEDSPMGRFLRDGITGFKLSAAEKAALLEVSRPHLEVLHAQRRLPQYRSGTDNVFRMPVAELAQGRFQEAGRVLFSLFNTYRWGEMARDYMGTLEAPLATVMYKVADARDTATQWQLRGFDDGRPASVGRGLHIDAKCYFDIKVIIYLSEVNTLAEGAFGYCLGSNYDVPSMEELAIRAAAEEFNGSTPRCADRRARFAALPPGYQKKIDFGSDMPDDSSALAHLLQTEKLFFSREADCVLFDTRGVHRGGYVYEGERSILQITWRGRGRRYS
ncbi:MAG: hypothetical protein OHK0024_04560 [Thalassobaculales bacterium]